jgi:hypothetical protein
MDPQKRLESYISFIIPRMYVAGLILFLAAFDVLLSVDKMKIPVLTAIDDSASRILFGSPSNDQIKSSDQKQPSKPNGNQKKND